MRVQHWIKPVLSMLAMIACARDIWAQGITDPYGGTNGVARVPSQPIGYAGGHPAAPQNPYQQALSSPEMYGGYPANTPVSAYPFDGSAYGPTLQPWPEISPFDNAYQSHQVQGGLWEQINHGFGKKWYARAEYLSTRTRKPEGIVGDTHVQSYWAQEFPSLYSDIPNGGGNGGSGSGGGTGGGGTGGGTGGTQSDLTALSESNFYNRLDLHALGDIFGKGGRFTAGWWNPDQSGVGVGFWFTGDSKEIFDARKDATRVQTGLSDLMTLLSPPDYFLSDIGQANKYDIFEQNLLNLRGLPVNDGTKAGYVIPYDLYFQVENRSQSLGANANYYFTPIVDRKNIKLRPLAGARYLRIDEGFSFVGVDSGMLYQNINSTNPIRDLKLHPVPNAFDDDQDGIVDNAGVGTEGGGGGTGGGSSGTIALFTVLTPDAGPYPFNPTTSFVTATSLSNLYGPEIGFQFDLGGDKLKLTGETKFGLLVNHEKINLRGDNIGSITRSATAGLFEVAPPETGNGDDNNVPPVNTPPTTFIENDPGLFTPTAQNPHPNAFKDQDEQTHLSPVFEQSIFADARLFAYVPVLKDIAILDQANFRVGYTFIWANEIATTDQSIVWDGKPTAGLFPHLNLNRETWWTSNWSFGVSWDF